MKTFITIILTAICTWLLIGFIPPSVLDFEKVGKVTEEEVPKGRITPQISEEGGNTWEVQIGEIDEENLGWLLFSAINKYRMDEGVNSIKVSKYWQGKAEEHNQWMADNRQFEHSDLNNFENILLYTGYESEEVICQKTMESWKESSGHNANLLNQALNTCGLGVTQDGSCVYVTFMAD